MEYKTQCRVLRGVGGLYYVSLADENLHSALYPATSSPLAGRSILTRARGALRTPDGGKIKVGDLCEFIYTDNSFTEGGIPQDDSSGLPEGAISAILPRRNSLIRPPLSNLDILVIDIDTCLRNITLFEQIMHRIEYQLLVRSVKP